MSQRIFISSVQREFAKERKALAEYVRKDAILGRFFDVFLFEEVPAQERKADGVYLAEVDSCDIYLGIFGHTYGNVDSSGVSATEREYLRAGTGDIIARCREWGLPDPQWQIEDDDDFVMVMPRPQSSVKSSIRSSVKSSIRSSVKSVDKSVDKTVDWTVDKTVDWTVDKTADGSTNERILNLLVTNPRATQEELARVLGLSVRGIEYAIGTLKKAKRIRKVGGKRFGHWEVIG